MNTTSSRFLLVCCVAVLAAPVMGQKGVGVPGSYYRHSGFVLGGTISIDFGFSGLSNAAAAVCLSQDYGPEVHPLLGLSWMGYSSPTYQPIIVAPDVNGNVHLEGPVPLDPGILYVPTLYSHGFIADPSLPAPGWSLTKTVAFVFNTQDGYRQVGSMSEARAMHTATSLARSPNDDETRVFIAGGGTGSVLYPIPSTTTELYNPMKRVFEPGPTMLEARQHHEAVLMLDGRVLLIGGINSAKVATRSCELFDPVGNNLLIAVPMLTPRVGHRATVLNDGRVLVTGGLAQWDVANGGLALQCNTATRSAEIYDPLTNTWTGIPQLMTEARAGHSQTKLQDGRVLIAFGLRAGQFFGTGDMPLFANSTEIFDPVTNSFSITGTLIGAPFATTFSSDFSSFSRAHHGASLLPSGEVLITGGFGNVAGSVNWTPTLDTVVRATCGRYDPVTGRWLNLPALGRTVAFHRQETSLLNGDAIMMGGLTNVTTFAGTAAAWRHNSVVPYDTQNIGSYSGLGITTSSPAGNLTMTRLYDGFSYLVCGGQDGNGTVRSTAFVVHEL